jgi:hypothetical protein
MTQDQLNQVAVQLRRAAEILETPEPAATKINTLETIGAICSHHGRRWGEEEFYKMVDNLNQMTV